MAGAGPEVVSAHVIPVTWSVVTDPPPTHLMSVRRYIVSSLSENWVPGMSMVQENMVWRERRAVARLVLTVTSYMRPLLTVVVVTSL